MECERFQNFLSFIRRHEHFMSFRLHPKAAHLMPAVIFCAATCVLAQTGQELPDHPQPQQTLPHAAQSPANTQGHRQNQTSKTTAAPPQVDAPWPREAPRGDEKFLMYQPQLETWEGDEVHAYAALSVESKGNSKPKYGV